MDVTKKIASNARNLTPEFHRCEIRSARSVFVMKTSTFRIVPLPTEVAEEARHLVEAGAADHAVIKVDSATGFPCRHCLRWAQPGERVILFPYATREYPADFRNGRAFRAYDADYNMIDAEIVNGREPEAVIEKLLQNPKTEFVDARSLTRGCFTFRILRA